MTPMSQAGLKPPTINQSVQFLVDYVMTGDKSDRNFKGELRDFIRSHLENARNLERERCARIALGLDSVDRGELTMDDWEHSLRSQTALDIAARIRGADAPK